MPRRMTFGTRAMIGYAAVVLLLAVGMVLAIRRLDLGVGRSAHAGPGGGERDHARGTPPLER